MSVSQRILDVGTGAAPPDEEEVLLLGHMAVDSYSGTGDYANRTGIDARCRVAAAEAPARA